MMKKLISLLLALMMLFTCAAYADDAPSERTVAPYDFTLAADEQLYYENLIFNSDVIINGDNAQIIFVNCEFNGDVILTAEVATRVLLLGCEVNGRCVMQNGVQEATLMEYIFPKILTDTPVEFVCEDCVGTALAMGDFEIVFNGQTYSMADSEMFSDANNLDAGLVPYEGQEAAYFIISQWWEDGKQNVLKLCESEMVVE